MSSTRMEAQMETQQKETQPMTHTPGPWRVGDAGATVFSPPNGKPAPQIIASITTQPFASANQKANARLIAAAPELLEACKEASEMMGCEKDCTKEYGKVRENYCPKCKSWVIVLDAIAHAEGRG